VIAEALPRPATAIPPAPPPATRRPVTPFKFLDYYEEKDAPLFAGRERDVGRIADVATVARTVVLYGKSGLGKTSILLAGVFPELRARGCLPIHLRTLQRPIEDVYAEVARKVGAGAAERAPSATQQDLVALLRNASKEQTLVLVLDQFEEFFIRFAADASTYQAFVEAVGAIVSDSRLKTHVIFSLREEYLAELDDFRSQLPALFENEYRLRPLTAFGVREAVTRPLEVSSFPFETRVVAKLVDALATQRFDSVVLQILCQEAFEHAVRRDPLQPCLTVADLEEVGNIDAVFKRYLDEMARGLSAEDQLPARLVLRALMTNQRTKQAMRIEDFDNTPYRVAVDEVSRVLQTLKSNRLVRDDERGGQTWYELTHERLVPLLERWLSSDKAFGSLVAAQDLIAACVRGGVWRDNVHGLLSKGLLVDVVAFFRWRLRLGPDAIECLLLSAMHEQHESVTYWAGLHGVEPSRQLVLAKLAATDPAFRRAAAFAAGRICRGDGRVWKELVRVALLDKDASVRSEAARALHGVGDEAPAGNLVAALRHPGTAANALSALTLMYLSGAKLPRLSRWTRWRVRRLAWEMVTRENRLVIGDAGVTALRGGYAGAAGWLLAVALTYALLLAWYMSGLREGALSSNFLLVMGVAAASSFSLPFIFAYTAGRSFAARTFMPGPKDWGYATRRSTAYRMTLWLLVLCGGFASLAGERETLVYSAAVFACALLLPWALRLAELGAGGGGALARLSMRSLTASLGFPVLVTGLLAGVATLPSVARYGDGLAALFLGMLPVLSAMTAVVATGLAHVVTMHGPSLTGYRRKPVPAWRSVHAVVAALALLGACLLLGPGVIPWRLPAHLTAGSGLSLDADLPERPFESVQYRRFDVDGFAVVTADLLPGWSNLLLDGSNLDQPGRLLVRPGGHLVAFHEKGPYYKSLALYRLPVLDATPGLEVSYLPKLVWTSWKIGRNEGGGVHDWKLTATIEGIAPGSVAINLMDVALIDGSEDVSIYGEASCGGAIPAAFETHGLTKPWRYISPYVVSCLVSPNPGDHRFSVDVTFLANLSRDPESVLENKGIGRGIAALMLVPALPPNPTKEDHR
jgi:hypothetical protein